MKLFDILKEKGLFSKEIRTRFKNKQIKVNGISVPQDFEFDSDITFGEIGEVIAELCHNEIWHLQLKLIGIENIMNSNIKTNLKNELEKFHFVEASKKDKFVIINNKI